MNKILYFLIFLISISHIQIIYSQWELLTGPGGGNVENIINPKANTYLVRTYMGVYKSTDGTASWYQVNDSLPHLFRPGGTIIAGKDNTILLSVYGHVIGAARLFLSTNCGETWTNISTARRVSSIAFKDNYIFYSVSASQSPEGIYRSSDYGSSWEHLPQFDEGGTFFVKDNFLFYLYSTYSDSLMRSSDNGNTWEFVHKGFIRSFSNYNNLMLASSNGYLLKSSDYGSTWDSIPSAFSIYKMLQHSNYLFAVNYSDFYFYRSTDIGQTWQQVVTDYKLSEFCSDGIKLVTVNDGIQQSTDNGNVWAYRDSGLTSLGIFKIFSDNNNIFAFNFGSISVSNDNGQSWSNIYDSLVRGGNQTFAVADNNYFVCTDSAIYRSSDNGHNWINIKGSIPWSTTGNAVGNAFRQLYLYTQAGGLMRSTNLGINWTSLPAFPGSGITSFIEHNNYLFAISPEKYGIYRSSNAGNNWILCNNGIADSMIYYDSLIVSMYYSGSELYCCTNSRVFKSVNEGSNWTNISSNIPGTDNYYYGLTAYGGFLYLGAYRDGIYISSNAGANWVLSEQGMNNRYVRCLTSNATHIFAGTAAYVNAAYESGIYRMPVGVIVNNQQNQNNPNKFYLYQNYPNPFNPSTKIKFTIPLNVKRETTNISLKIYNILGAEIADVTSLIHTIGKGLYEIDWNAEDFPSGVYFYQLKTVDFTDTKKMIFIK